MTTELLDLLSPLEAKLLAAVVLADGHVGRAALAHVVGCRPGEADAALDTLDGLGLVRDVPAGSVIAAHAYVRHAVLDTLDPDERRRLHAALAGLLAADGGSSALVSAHAEAAGDRALATTGILAAAAAAGDALRLGETDAVFDLLARIERLARRLPG